MKKLNLLIIALEATFVLSCHHKRRVVIASNSGNYSMRLEYSGTMAFYNDGTKLEGISNDGYIDYKRNNDDLYVSADHAGRISYQLDGTKLAKLDNTAQNMLDEAIRMIIKSNR